MGQRSFLSKANPVNIMANLKGLEYILLIVFSFLLVVLITGIRHPLFLATIAILASYILVNLLNARLRINRIQEKWHQLIDDQSHAGDGKPANRLIALKQEALDYCSDLVEYYHASKRLNRRLYYAIQLAIIILSAMTPIVALIAQNSNQPSRLQVIPLIDALISIDPTQPIDLNRFAEVIRWIPVVLPAIAAILASISTAFPFQETWIKANMTGELLEAEREKFIIDLSINSDEHNTRITIKNFINRINRIHFRQIQEWTSMQINYSEKDSEIPTHPEIAAPVQSDRYPVVSTPWAMDDSETQTRENQQP
jgi:hypothetical protein